jgi:ribosomal protein L11 methyltransferase
MEGGATAVSEQAAPNSELALTVYAAPEDLDRIADAVRRYVERWAPDIAFTCDRTWLTDDWRLSWVSHLEEIQLTPRLRLVPLPDVGVVRAPSPDVLYLEAGLVFGFGEHPTTRMAARWVEAHASQATLLDVGTGTGILALVAARAGASAVLGLDIDPASVASAQANAARNAVAGCEFSCLPVQHLERDFAVVVANVDAATLSHLSASLVRCVRTGGVLALTGVLLEQAEQVVRSYAAHSFVLEVVEQEADWVLLCGTHATNKS